jgi:hypothetical protein
MKTHLAVLQGSFIESAETTPRPHQSGVMSRVIATVEEAPPSSFDFSCGFDHCDSCDAYRDRACGWLYGSQPPPPRELSVANVDFDDPTPPSGNDDDDSPYALRSEALRPPPLPATSVAERSEAHAPMHLASCEGDSCQSCGAYGDRMCSLLYGR